MREIFKFKLNNEWVSILHCMCSHCVIIFVHGKKTTWINVILYYLAVNCYLANYPVKNVTWIFSLLFDGSLVENDTKSDGNPIMFLANAMEIPWLQLVQNPCHVWAWKISINDVEYSWNLVSIRTKLPPSRVVTGNDMEFSWESLSHFLQG